LTTTKKAATLVHHLNQPPGTLIPQVYQVVIFIYSCTAAVIIREADNGSDISAPPAADVGSIVVECRRCGIQQRAWEIAPPPTTYRKLPPCFFDFARTDPTPAAQVEAYRSSGSQQQSRHDDEQPDAEASQEEKVIAFDTCTHSYFEATWGTVDGASIMRMTVQSLKDLIRSSPESKHLGVTARKEVLQSRALSFLHADAGVGTNSLMSDE
jgi:hypothetical protein